MYSSVVLEWVNSEEWPSTRCMPHYLHTLSCNCRKVNFVFTTKQQRQQTTTHRVLYTYQWFYLLYPSSSILIKHLHSRVLVQFLPLRCCYQMAMKLVSKRLTRKSFYKPTHLVGCDPAVSAEHKHQLQRSKSFHGTLEELFDPKMSLWTQEYFLVSRRLREKDRICAMLFPPVYKPGPQHQTKDCLQLTSIYLMPIMS